MEKPDWPVWHVLFVDDDEEEFLLTREMLGQAIERKITLEWASGYEDGQECLQAGPYDAVFVDYDLDLHTGIELIREISSKGYQAPLILFSGRGSPDIIIEAMQAGATFYITKSDANPYLLERSIRYAIERKRYEQERVEEALRESEEKLRLALTASGAGAWSWDLGTNTLHWSDEYYRIFGYEPGSIQPSVEDGFKHMHPDDIPRVVTMVGEAIENGSQIDVEHRVIWPDGSVHWVRGLSRSFHNEIGKTVRMAGIAMDITEQKQKEMELDAAHRQTVEILESFSDAFYSLDQEERFTYVNQKATSLWGKQPEDLLGKNIWEIFPSGKDTESYRRIKQALADKQPTHYESYSAFLDQWVEIHLYPTEQGISVYFQDITERKRSEAVLEVYTKELERSNRDLQEFAFVASHDLQEPLRKIEAFGDLILGGSMNLTESQRDQFERMRESAGRMRKMVDGLLQLSRLTTHAQPFQPVDLQQVTREVISDLELLILQTGGVVEVGELPVIQADALQMRQLLQNLIGNALKFQPPGGKPEVKVFSRPLSTALTQILIQDNGIGFNQELAERIFQPFKRLVGRSEYEGSGIGLAIARKIVERHGGEINVRSTPNHGSEFTVTLPLEQSGAQY